MQKNTPEVTEVVSIMNKGGKSIVYLVLLRSLILKNKQDAYISNP